MATDPPAARASPVGYSPIGGICNSNIRVSTVEAHGLNSVSVC